MLQEKIDWLKERMEYVESLNHALSLLHWDGAVHAPKNSVHSRSSSIGTLSSKIFELTISDEVFQKTVNELLEQKDQLDEVLLISLKLMKEEIEQFSKIPAKEFGEYNALKVKANHIWEQAKEASDFNLFAPYLKELIDYNRKFIAYRGYTGHPYNTLLNDYEKGITTDELDLFFKTLKCAISPLVKRIKEEGKSIDTSFLEQAYSKSVQADYCQSLLELIGFDTNSGLMEESTHPFTLNLDIDDVRLTTRYFEDLPLSSIFSTLHEGGHGIYEQSIDKKYSRTPVATGTSMGIHESQSRFYENLLGRSYAFWEYALPKLKEQFPTQLGEVTLEQFYAAVNASSPSLIRVEADELTYSLHIMIRYEIEKGLIEGSIEVDDLPAIWNAKYEEYLGIVPSNDAKGVLQDVHWSDGLLGYFPSYALGNVYACQFYEKMKDELDIPSLLKEGNFLPINEWLREHIHKYGSSMTPKEILNEVTGEGLNPDYFITYLQNKYEALYF